MADGNLRDRLVAKFGKTIFPVEKTRPEGDTVAFKVSDEIYASETMIHSIFDDDDGFSPSEKEYYGCICEIKLCESLAGDLFKVLEKADGYIGRDEVNMIMKIQADQKILYTEALEFAARHPIRARFRELFLGR